MASSRIKVVLLCLVLASVCRGQEQVRWLVRCSDVGVRLTGATAHRFAGMASAPWLSPAGEFALHFARDALGKPESLAVTASAGATVTVAVEPAPAVEPQIIAAGKATNYRFVATVMPSPSAGACGLVARDDGDGRWYRFVWDRSRSRLRLERAMGSEPLVLADVEAPAADAGPHRLALQVDGFRLQAWFDDALVLQALDGAHVQGGWRTWAADPDDVQWSDVQLEPPAASRASIAAVTLGGEAQLFAATAAPAGHHAVLELSLDRPHPAVPRTLAGSELWLLQREAAPRVLLGDFKGALGADTIVQLRPDGYLRCGLRWPAGTALAGQVALARIVVVTPDGDRLVARTPCVPVAL